MCKGTDIGFKVEVRLSTFTRSSLKARLHWLFITIRRISRGRRHDLVIRRGKRSHGEKGKETGDRIKRRNVTVFPSRTDSLHEKVSPSCSAAKRESCASLQVEPATKERYFHGARIFLFPYSFFP